MDFARWSLRRSKSRAAAQDIIEPYLIRYGFFQFALRGRLATGHGLSSLTLPEPSLDHARLGRFDHGDD